jgi:hypothetical protein
VSLSFADLYFGREAGISTDARLISTIYLLTRKITKFIQH